MERRRGESPEARFQQLEREIAARLRPVCPQLPESEFAELVKHVAAVNVKYAFRRTSDMFHQDQELMAQHVEAPPRK